MDEESEKGESQDKCMYMLCNVNVEKTAGAGASHHRASIPNVATEKCK